MHLGLQTLELDAAIRCHVEDSCQKTAQALAALSLLQSAGFHDRAEEKRPLCLYVKAAGCQKGRPSVAAPKKSLEGLFGQFSKLNYLFSVKAVHPCAKPVPTFTIGKLQQTTYVKFLIFPLQSSSASLRFTFIYYSAPLCLLLNCFS